MELRRYLHVVRRRLAVVVAVVIIFTGLGVLATSAKTEYSATAVIYVGSRSLQLTGNAATNAAQALSAANAVLPTFAKLLDSEPVAEATLQASGIPRTARQVTAETSATTQTNTQLLTVTVTDPNPSIAQRLANGMSNAFVAKLTSSVNSSSTPSGVGTTPTAPANLFERATLPTAPIPSKTARNAVLGFIFGLVASLGVVALLEYLNVTIRSAEDAERLFDLPVIGIIPAQR